MVARAQKEAASAAQRGDRAETQQWLGTARGWIGTVPASPDVLAETAALNELEHALETGHDQAFVKGAKYHMWSLARQPAIAPLPVRSWVFCHGWELPARLAGEANRR